MLLMTLINIFFLREREDLMMKVGDVVIYESKRYKIVHIYKSGYCEIKKEDSSYEVLLVKLSELKN